jgi:hypothetical protein
VILAESELDPSDHSAIVGQIRSAMKAINPSAQMTSSALLAWGSAKLIAAAAEGKVGVITSKEMLKYLDSLRNVNLDGALHNLSMIGPKDPAFKRVFNYYGINYKIVNGTPTRQGGFYSVLSAM